MKYLILVSLNSLSGDETISNAFMKLSTGIKNSSNINLLLLNLFVLVSNIPPAEMANDAVTKNKPKSILLTTS